MNIWPGQPYPLGATYDGQGTNFSVFSEVAERVEICLFDDQGNQTCMDLPEVTAFCWPAIPGRGSERDGKDDRKRARSFGEGHYADLHEAGGPATTCREARDGTR